MTGQETETAQPPRASRRADVIWGAVIVAVFVIVAARYGATLRAIAEGVAGFSAAALVLLVGLIAAALAFVGLPALGGEAETAGPAPAGLRGTARQNRALEILSAEKLRLLRAIRDLDFDYDMGKLSDTIYTEQRLVLIHQAIAVLARLEALEETIAAQQRRIEAALSAFRQEHT